jgi:hypothetical protein
MLDTELEWRKVFPPSPKINLIQEPEDDCYQRPQIKTNKQTKPQKVVSNTYNRYTEHTLGWKQNLDS